MKPPINPIMASIEFNRFQTRLINNMDLKDDITLLISIFSACAAILSVIFSRLALERQRYMQGWIANHDLLNRTNAMVMQDHVF